MKKKLFLSALVMVFLTATVAAFALEDVESTSTFQNMERTESIVFGQGRTGGLIERLSQLEVALFGRELPGSIAARQNALYDFLEKGNIDQPSMLFKLGVAEWALSQEIDPYTPVSDRIAFLERSLEGQTMENKPLAMRLERLLSLLLSDSITWHDVEIPSESVMKVTLMETLSPGSIKEGDKVRMSLEEDLVVGDSLVAPKGSRVLAHVETVKKPKSFGRPSEITISFDKLDPLGPESVPLTLGEASEEAVKAEKAQMAAVGTSFVGAILLGPVGLAGGLLVRGDAKDIPEGTTFFVQTSETSRVSGYSVPLGLQGMIQSPPVSSGDGGDTLGEVSSQ